LVAQQSQDASKARSTARPERQQSTIISLLPKAGEGENDFVSATPREFLEIVVKDPDVRNWLISVSELQKVRAEYLVHLSRFLNWAHLTPAEVFSIKREAMKQGEPSSMVEHKIRSYHEALRRMGYAGKTRAAYVAAILSYISSKGYSVPKKLVRVDSSNDRVMRVPEKKEVELFFQYAPTITEKLLYSMMTESPCRPRVFAAMRWNWLESEWWALDVVHVTLPLRFRPEVQGGPKKFEPICFLGPKSIDLLKQLREAEISAGRVPCETERILPFNSRSMAAVVRRDYESLVRLHLVRASRRDEKGNLIEQPLTPKSWRKYQFNIIDALGEISPEWRLMLKGRDLQTERYYSRQNVEELREIYAEKIYPKLWSDTTAAVKLKEMERLRAELAKVKDDLSWMMRETGLRLDQRSKTDSVP
jgi:hypothetical protein